MKRTLKNWGCHQNSKQTKNALSNIYLNNFDLRISEHLPDDEQLTGGLQFVDQIHMTPK
jgi:hypothetical protein